MGFMSCIAAGSHNTVLQLQKEIYNNNDILG